MNPTVEQKQTSPVTLAILMVLTVVLIFGGYILYSKTFANTDKVKEEAKKLAEEKAKEVADKVLENTKPAKLPSPPQKDVNAYIFDKAIKPLESIKELKLELPANRLLNGVVFK